MGPPCSRITETMRDTKSVAASSHLCALSGLALIGIFVSKVGIFAGRFIKTGCISGSCNSSWQRPASDQVAWSLRGSFSWAK
ncbi:hypothetical protein MPTK1_1g14705 [Marchantia polymorpha subsp. ruderalis]